MDEKSQSVGVAMISGDESVFYLVNGTRTERLCRIRTELQKRQKKGGQSQARIARLCEQKRAIYVRQIAETVNRHFLEVKRVILAGPGELKQWTRESDIIDYRIKGKISQPIAFPDLDILSFVQGPLQTVVDGLETDTERGHVRFILETMEKSPESMVYGDDVIRGNLEGIKTLYVHEDREDDWKELHGNVVVISKKLEGAVVLQNFGGAIGLLYFEGAYME